MKNAVVIGAGFAGLSSACFLAKAGFKVTVLEKHDAPGGRARQYKQAGFTFDMGPSWYWMPDVFERFFQQFNKKTSDYYSLKRLDPSYRVYWQDGFSDIPANIHDFKKLLESWEPDASQQLDKFLAEAEYKYKVGIQKLVHKPGRSILEFADADVMKGMFRLDIFQSVKKHIAKYFRNEKIRQLLEFPVLFLGALPEKTPALYSLMNYADIVGGTWYPEKGIYSVVQAMYDLAVELGVEFHFNTNVSEVSLHSNSIHEVTAGTEKFSADVVIGSADYHHIETTLLPEGYRSYSESYWESRTMAPSCILYYVGLNKKLKNIVHHSLFFDTSFDVHGKEIYTDKTWPADPLFYVSAVSVTDPAAAPPDGENLFFLIPVAAGLTNDNEALKEKYFKHIIQRYEQRIGEQITNNIVVYKSFAGSDFVTEYNAFKGNAYGLANTLKQTAVLKPACKSKKINNLYYTGQLTVPGPGVPPALISGEVVAKEVIKEMLNR